MHIALRLLRDGANTTITTRFPRDAVRRFSSLPDAADWLHRLRVVGIDLRDPAQVLGLAESVAEAGPLDILINNCGVSSTQRLLDVTEEDFSYVMDTNLRGSFFVAQQVAKRMVVRAKGDPRKQHRIVNIASVAGLRVMPQIGVYCMSKAGVVQMTKAMAVEWGKYGINVNAICPGYISTEINEEYFESEQGKRLIDMLPRKRPGRPEDLDGLLLLLAAEETRFINGAIITADDGMTAQ
jgi:NAD(P)-dependent dehydrogenase (short-subunit alcohol dehydrogenase family)